MFELMEISGQQAVIKVLGIGGGGGNAVDHMLSANLEGVEFINANTIHRRCIALAYPR
jgi:cell division protein FtsZ